ncbi:hypothetical protein F6X40_09890 [Paraburkholderia sp. UCT31]|uniref:hypothetical protein n=1 Tax=Paraburkholderia sp. UCT31 TaxID=2615209 RepID=UPI00165564A8|nr:hypothetical protein [Paraburkholderia sp. UCT31]MBC8737119.1 hypothetical protein [Paraburkholderia sp. UCT31]
MTVIDFKSKAFWKELNERFDCMRTDINYGGITRHMSAANQTAGDEITLDAETGPAVKELFPRYGFPGEPKTWAEFRAVHAYIERVEEAVDTFRIGFRNIPQHGIDFLRDKYSDVFAVVMAIVEGDYAKVAAMHKRCRTFQRLVRDYDELAELPDPEPRKSVP